jgi:hypothetical protein
MYLIHQVKRLGFDRQRVQLKERRCIGALIEYGVE